MGQTLTHGVYLPDEGERNCYSGLAANWQILDTSVGTIAAHTAALAGKASLVHTHTKADITDFPAYGNAAGTICEGNDSRLSDARNPVAHTHTKSDVTDLFNSANVWTGGNTYTATISYQTSYTLGNPPQSDDSQTVLKINDSAGANYLAQIATFQNTDATGLRIAIRDKFDSNGFSPSGSNRNKYFTFLQNAANQSYLRWDGYINNSVAPLANNTYDLGSPSYQWNNLYAKNYFYNGTAWGLDKANVWTGSNTFTNSFTLRNTSWSGKTPPSSRKIVEITLSNSDTVQSRVISRVDTNSTETWITTIRNINANTSYDSTLIHVVDNAGNRKLQPLYGDVALGASASGSRFKTFNGINPGALSLPNFDSDGYTDLSSDLTENVQYTYTPTVDGWLAVYAQVTGFHAENAVGIFNGDTTLGNNSFRWAASATAAINLQRQTGKYFGSVILPVRAGYPYLCWLRVNQSTPLGQKWLIFYKAKGNV